MVTFVDPKRVPAMRRRGRDLFGYCYERAGFNHVGYTQGGLWAWQLLPDAMPEPQAPVGANLRLFAPRPAYETFKEIR